MISIHHTHTFPESIVAQKGVTFVSATDDTFYVKQQYNDELIEYRCLVEGDYPEVFVEMFWGSDSYSDWMSDSFEYRCEPSVIIETGLESFQAQAMHKLVKYVRQSFNSLLGAYDFTTDFFDLENPVTVDTPISRLRGAFSLDPDTTCPFATFDICYNFEKVEMSATVEGSADDQVEEWVYDKSISEIHYPLLIADMVQYAAHLRADLID